jgi:hypothetical protein
LCKYKVRDVLFAPVSFSSDMENVGRQLGTSKYTKGFP